MIKTMSLEEYNELIKKKNTTFEKKKSKYNSSGEIVDGIRFDSKLEARYYLALKRQLLTKEIKYFLRQVPFHLPGRTTYRVDFMIVENDGSIRYVDTKGYETEAFKIKKRQVEHLYPVKIELVKNARV